MGADRVPLTVAGGQYNGCLAPSEQAIVSKKSLKDRSRGLTVETTEDIIKDHNALLRIDRPSQSLFFTLVLIRGEKASTHNPLLLSTAESNTPRSHHGGITPGKT